MELPVQKRIFEYLPLSIRIETVGGVATPLVLRGTPLPAKRSETFSTGADNQVTVSCKLCMGERPLTRDNIQLGTFELKGLPPANRGQLQITIEFLVDATCGVTARGRLQTTGILAEKHFNPPEGFSDELIAKILADAESNRDADEAELLRVETTNRTRNLIATAEEQLAKASNTKLSEAVAAVGLALASGDSYVIREKSDALDRLLSKASLFGPGYSGFDFADIFGSLNKPKPPARQTEKRSSRSEQTLASQTNPQVLGKIFGGTSFTLDPSLCFVLMPFDPKLQPLYEDHIRPTVMRSGLRCERADDIRGTNLITWDIWERINRARFLIADLTRQNPNVFYELGLAHALSKEVILITQSIDFVPFDLKTIRCIEYDFTPRGIPEFERKLGETIAALMKLA